MECGVQELKAALEAAGVKKSVDMQRIRLALQGYNSGNGYILWELCNYGSYSVANATEFSNMQAARLVWSSCGDKQYVAHVLQYYPDGSGRWQSGYCGAGTVPARTAGRAALLVLVRL